MYWNLFRISVLGFRSLTSAAAAFTAAVVMVSATLQAGPPPPVHREQDLPPAVLARPVVVYNRPYTGAIYGDYVPSAEEGKVPFAPAIPRLGTLLSCGDSFIRLAVTFVLSTIGQDAATLLEQSARDPEHHVAGLAENAREKLKQQ